MSILIDYTNYKGVRAIREIGPLSNLRWGTTEYHPEPQWLFDAMDIEKAAMRTFALSDVHAVVSYGEKS